MNALRAPGTVATIERSVAELGAGALREIAIQTHVAPLFSRVLRRNKTGIDLANHSLGRPLDATAEDVAEAIGLWQSRLGDAWDAWLAEMGAYRSRLARLLGAPEASCVVPKTSAGQGLRAILNTYDSRPRVLATRGEFDSLDVILRHYARRGRIALSMVEPRADGVALVGDAAGFYDPFTGEGLYTALRGAELLAEVAHDALRGGACSRAAVALTTA